MLTDIDFGILNFWQKNAVSSFLANHDRIERKKVIPQNKKGSHQPTRKQHYRHWLSWKKIKREHFTGQQKKFLLANEQVIF